MLYTIIRKGGEYMAVSYSNRIRPLRKKLKMTQKQMVEQLFIDQSTLATYENGTRETPAWVLDKLADYYKVSTDYLLGRTDLPEQPKRSKRPRLT